MTTGDRLSATGGGNVLSGRVGGFAVQSGAVHGDVRISLPPTTLTAIYAAPRELPVAPALWVDRADQLAALDQLLSCGQEPPDRPLVIVITGPDGIGKSALALHWLHRHCDRFEGELYANLQGHTPGGHPATPAEILGRFLRAFGVPAERIPAELDELTALFRSEMADRRMHDSWVDGLPTAIASLMPVLIPTPGKPLTASGYTA